MGKGYIMASSNEPLRQELAKGSKSDDGYVEGTLLFEALGGFVLKIKRHSSVQCQHSHTCNSNEVNRAYT
jgi:hypothetical protein